MTTTLISDSAYFANMYVSFHTTLKYNNFLMLKEIDDLSKSVVCIIWPSEEFTSKYSCGNFHSTREGDFLNFWLKIREQYTSDHNHPKKDFRALGNWVSLLNNHQTQTYQKLGWKKGFKKSEEKLCS